MNQQETLDRLEKEKKKLEEAIDDSDRNVKSLNKRKLKLVEDLITSYSQTSFKEPSNEEIEKIFSKIYGFTKQKEEIKTSLLLQKYYKAEGIENPESGKILCFVGPPGTGKTHFVDCFAEASGRKSYKISLGGSSDATIITGGEEMWIGAKSGKIVDAIAKTQSYNPVILLDEVEKSGKDTQRGSIENTLLHILDPEQNQHFKDHFLDVEIDISQITFILTANEEEKIPGPLKDRLEIIKLKGYDEQQKLALSKLLIEKIFAENQNRGQDLFEMDDDALRALIKKDDKPGARQLERNLRKIIHWCFVQWSQSLESGEEKGKIYIDEDKVNELIYEDPEDTKEKEKDDEKSKLDKRVKELEEENKGLKRERINLGILSPLEISQDQEFCNNHKKKVLWTSNETCSFCELEKQVKQFIAIIDRENQEKMEQIWKEQKLEWMKQSSELKDGSKEEQELAQQIKSSIKKIDKRLQQVKKGGSGSTSSSQPGLGIKDWMLIGGGIIILFLIGGIVWIFFTKKKKKKPGLVKSNRLLKTNQLSLSNSRKVKKINNNDQHT